MSSRTENFRTHITRINKLPERRQAVNAARIEVDLFRKRYQMFKRGEVDEINLAVLDFNPSSNILSSNEPRTEIKYEDIYKRFLDTFMHDAEEQYDGTISEAPEPISENLIQFVLQKPFEKLNFRYNYFLLKTDFPYQNAINVKRYFQGNPLRVSKISPVAEIWTASRTRLQFMV